MVCVNSDVWYQIFKHQRKQRYIDARNKIAAKHEHVEMYESHWGGKIFYKNFGPFEIVIQTSLSRTTRDCWASFSVLNKGAPVVNNLWRRELRDGVYKESTDFYCIIEYK